jgi:fermentation-respiration switch protein FrsA (DUF1100 family)
MGESMGGVIAILTAARELEAKRRLAFVATDSAPAALLDIVQLEARRRYGTLLPRLMLAPALRIASWRCRFDPADVVATKYATYLKLPVFVSHSAADTVVPASHARAIYADLPGRRKSLHVNDWGAEHVEDIRTNFEAYRSHLYDFLDRHVPNFGRSSRAPRSRKRP